MKKNNKTNKWKFSHRGYEIIEENKKFIAIIGSLKLRESTLEKIKSKIDTIRNL
jgi:hypothetical protein